MPIANIANKTCPRGLVTIQVNVLSMCEHVQGWTSFLPPLASGRVCFLDSFWCIQGPVWFGSQDVVLFKGCHGLPSTASCGGAAVVFVGGWPGWRAAWAQGESGSAT